MGAVGARAGRWSAPATADGIWQPEFADGDAGGGVDFRLHSRLSLRGEGDWLYTTYFSQTQNNFQLVAGVVFHF